jgi:menaquinone-dependent protoporphyrinogen oxidase
MVQGLDARSARLKPTVGRLDLRRPFLTEEAFKTEPRFTSNPEVAMSTKVLVAFATYYGSTQEVAEAVATTLRERGVEVDLRLLREVRTLAGYSAVILGAPLAMHRWHKDALGFLSRHRQALLLLPVAVFALGPVHDPHDAQEWQDSRTQLDKELAKFPWFKPVALEMFGGKFDPALLRFPLNKLAGPAPASDIRDWKAIRAWAGNLATMFAHSA